MQPEEALDLLVLDELVERRVARLQHLLLHQLRPHHLLMLVVERVFQDLKLLV